jgi:hypothetical protein
LTANRLRRDGSIVLLIVLATGISWLKATNKKSSSTQDAIISTSTGAVCGTLTSHDGALTVKIGASEKPIGPGSTITVVTKCP